MATGIHNIPMKIQAIVFIITLSAFLITSSCKKDFTTAIATVLNTEKTTGCGFVVEIDKVKYHAENLDSQFQSDSLQVYVNVKLVSGVRYYCGTSTAANSAGIGVIHINQIAKVTK